MTFSNLPIATVGTGTTEYPTVTPVVGPPTADVVSPTIANQQPTQLDTRTNTLHDRIGRIITTLNEMTDELLQRDGSSIGSNMKGDLDMKDASSGDSYKVTNCLDGVNDQDAVTKSQLDVLTTTLSGLTTTLATAILRDGSVSMTANLDIGTNRIINCADPSGNQDVATKSYVDGLSGSVSNEYLKRDGSNAMLSDLDMGSYRVTNSAAPTSSSDAVTKGWMDGQLQGIGTAPSGSIAFYAGVNTPSGWLACDGTAYAQNSFPLLYSVLGTTYNTTASGNQFNVPDMRGRYLAGLDDSAGVLTRATLDALGETDGEEYVTLITSELPLHDHTYTDKYALYDGSGTDTGPAGSTSGYYINTVTNSTTATTGSSTPHENCPPTMALNVMIKT
jgi:microcystin-dependent protein